MLGSVNTRRAALCSASRCRRLLFLVAVCNLLRRSGGRAVAACGAPFRPVAISRAADDAPAPLRRVEAKPGRVEVSVNRRR